MDLYLLLFLSHVPQGWGMGMEHMGGDSERGQNVTISLQLTTT